MDWYNIKKKKSTNTTKTNTTSLRKTGTHIPQQSATQKLKTTTHTLEQMEAIFNPPKPVQVSPQKRTKLILAANKMYNDGDIEQARTIYAALHYHEGLTRVAADYYKAGKVLESFATFHHAGIKNDTEELGKQIANSIKTVLDKDKTH